MKRAQMRREWKEYRASAPHLKDTKFRDFVRIVYGFDLPSNS
jgi:hypothetical protein